MLEVAHTSVLTQGMQNKQNTACKGSKKLFAYGLSNHFGELVVTLGQLVARGPRLGAMLCFCTFDMDA